MLKGNTNVFTSNFVTESTESWDDDSRNYLITIVNMSLSVAPYAACSLLDYIVEIKPQDGLFSQQSARTTNGRPHPPRAAVSNPPEPRMPRSSGPGTEVRTWVDMDLSKAAVMY